MEIKKKCLMCREDFVVVGGKCDGYGIMNIIGDDSKDNYYFCNNCLKKLNVLNYEGDVN